MVEGRKKVLLDYLLEKQSSEWISKSEIVEELKELYPRHLEKSNEHNSTAFSNITRDVRDINRDQDVPVVIISSKKGYKVATDEEKAERFIKKEIGRSLRILKRAHTMIKKVSNNGQVDLLEDAIINAFPEAKEEYYEE